MNIKYIEERSDSNGNPYWIFNPPKYLREALNVKYKRFESIDDARRLSAKVDDDYLDHKRRLNGDHYVLDSTVNGIFAYYLGQEEWIDTAENTKRTFRMLMRNISEIRLGTANVRFGEMLAKNVSNDHSKQLKKELREQFSRHRSNHGIALMRLIWNIAMKSGRVSHNPFSKMRLKALPPRRTMWEEEEVWKFIDACESTGYPNLGLMALMCWHLCQRPGDMRQVTFNHLEDDELSFVQEKTGTEVDLELTEEIRERIDHLGRAEGTIVINDVTKRPHTRWSYYKQANVIIKQLGLPEGLRISDLRRTGATAMALSGASADEIRSVTGHQSRDVLNIYVRPTRGLARNGMKRRFG